MAETSQSHESPPGTSGGRLRVIVVTPEAAVLDEPADFVALTLYDGEIGIAPAHSPLIGRLGFGEMRLVQGGSTRAWYVDGGFVQVIGDQVAVLTSRVIPSGEIDTEAAAAQLEAARTRRADSPELMAIRDRVEAQSRAQLWVARRAQGAQVAAH